MKSKAISSALLKIGTRPGSVIYTGEENLEAVKINLISYDADKYTRKDTGVEELSDLDPNMTHWINISGIHDEETIISIGEMFALDSLVLEDIVTVGSRPKFEKYEKYSHLCMNTLVLKDDNKFIKQDDLSIVVINNIIITFEADQLDFFEGVRKRIFEDKGRIRKSKASYLFYCILDAGVDQYFYILNAFEEKIEILETKIMDSPEKEQAKNIYELRRELLKIKNAAWPLRDILAKLIKADNLFNKEELKFLNDVNDNIRQIIDFIASYRDLVMGLYEAYLSNLSNKMNRIMTTLTIFSVVFIPLTFLAGIYGMNFKYLPELNFKYAYPAFWLVSIIIVVVLYLFFKKKKWFV